MAGFFSVARYKGVFALVVIFLVLITDQVLKFYVKTTFFLGEIRPILGQKWANLYFVENRGMAFGLDMVGGTILLCSFRIIAVGFLAFFLIKILRKKFPVGFIFCICLIISGAAGNIFDNVLYGVLFSESTIRDVAEFAPFSRGYSSLFMGKVVDMFYFPVIQSEFPRWMPFCGGQSFVFFSPIFNFADSAITTGALSIVLFYRKSLHRAFS